MSLVKHILENDYNEKLHKNINPIISKLPTHAKRWDGL